jgi:hypothetical protein
VYEKAYGKRTTYKDIQIDGTITIKDPLKEIQYECVDCIHLAVIH